MKRFLWLICLCFLFSINTFAANRVINLVVGYKTVNFAGKPRKAIAVNNQIPAPTLHFKEGDHVTINVYNRLDKETAIHWHGVLVPWQMDGVLGVTQHGIPPGGVFHYQFTLLQSGTYWYHAHAGLQEQQGLYGAFLIDPLKAPSYHYDKDYVVVLSDWSNTNPEQILANLKKDGDYYSPDFPLQPSLAKFIHDYKKANREERKMLLDDYKMMQQMRMSIYDLSDVAYDAFLLNGQPNATPWRALVKKGDVVRLRFIGAAGDTIYHVKIPDTTMQMVHVEGNNVNPYQVEDFTIAPGETYDVLVKINENKPTIIYAEARDKVGAAYGALVTSPHQFVDYSQVTPFPEPLPVTQEMMANMMMSETGQGSTHTMTMQKNMNMHAGMSHMNMMDHASMKMDPPSHMQMTQSHDSMTNMSMSMKGMTMQAMNMSMPTEPTIIGDHITSMPEKSLTIGTKYQNLTADVKTNDPNKPVAGVIKMELFGYMGRFIWFINGLPEYEAKPIPLEPGKRYRIIFTNPSMMHHPMHIHQHWFILRNGHGAYDPLLHTIDVPPGSTVTADIDADASGNSFFHCHLLYHMMAGMSRVFQYSTLIEIAKGEMKPENVVKQTGYKNRPILRIDEVRPIDMSLVKHPMAHSTGFYLANMLDVSADPFNNAQKITFKGMYGPDYNKLELFTNDAEISKGSVENADLDIFYWHLLDQFWAIKGGINYFYRPAAAPYWQPGIGIEGLMPYFIDTDIRAYYYGGSAKLDIELSRDTQITNNFFVRLGIRSILASKTVTDAAIGSGLNQMRYIVRPYYRLMPGLNVFAEYENERYYGAFKNILRNEGEATGENTLSFGFSVLF
ncbi:MAG TPA: copper resistance system multicopper oxidase [Candidatus Babeliales bacterium]|nr:copper resistance system multicopper oxidase [Candidatus Babeliales bacterium]